MKTKVNENLKLDYIGQNVTLTVSHLDPESAYNILKDARLLEGGDRLEEFADCVYDDRVAGINFYLGLGWIQMYEGETLGKLVPIDQLLIKEGEEKEVRVLLDDQLIGTTTNSIEFDHEINKESDPRSHNVGNSDYSSRAIQPWDIWKEYDLNPWDADIVKRVLRKKSEAGMTEKEARILDYEKMIHICQFRIGMLKGDG